MASRPVIEYYFSFISLWSYIGSRRFRLLAKENNAQIIFKPVDLMHIFSISGGLPVKQRSPQRQAYRLVEMERWTGIRGIPIVPHPKFYPADPSLAHRVLLAAIEELGHDSEPVHEFVHRSLQAVWADELDIADPATIVDLAQTSGLDGARLLERAKTEGKFAEQEVALTEEAKTKRFFGAPLYLYRDEPFWGQDRLEMLDDVIKSGRDPIVLPESLD
ncbi:thioredoxin-like protein [Xylariales sp. PMI_506]|nr:thioredoxin-like protein [Xylariales sp. PMI_506]